MSFLIKTKDCKNRQGFIWSNVTEKPLYTNNERESSGF